MDKTIEFVSKAKAIHGEEYDYLKTVYELRDKRLIITCRVHGDFLIGPRAHLEGAKCPTCKKENERFTYEQSFLKEANEIHDNKYTYGCYTNTHAKIEIICSEHGSFSQRASSHLDGMGCPSCAKVYHRSNEEFIKEVQVEYPNLDYSNTNFTNMRTPIKVNCLVENHGVFEIFPSHHLNKKGCPICEPSKFDLDRKSLGDDFIKRAQAIHNNRWDYQYVKYHNAYTKVDIFCKTHGIFRQNPSGHLRGDGCPFCSKNTSLGETLWLDTLEVPKEFRHKRVDLNIENRKQFYFPDAIDIKNKIVWEFMGDYYHGNPRYYDSNDWNNKCKKSFGDLYQKTINKIKTLENEGYKVIWIWESDWCVQNNRPNAHQKNLEYKQLKKLKPNKIQEIS